MKRWLWIGFKACALLLLIGAVALAGYFIHLDKSITAKFEGRRWSIPAVVYARPLELFAGLRFSADALVAELQRVGYQAGRAPLLPGHYLQRDEQVVVHLRGFRFPEQARPATLVSLQFSSGLLTSLTSERGESLALIRLDPPAIGSIFPSHGEDRVIVTPEQVPELLHSVVYLAALMLPNGMLAGDMIGSDIMGRSQVLSLLMADPEEVGALRLDTRSEDADYIARVKETFYGECRSTVDCVHCITNRK